MRSSNDFDSELHSDVSPRSCLLELLDEAQRSGDDKQLASVLALLNEPLKEKQAQHRSPGSVQQIQQPDVNDQPKMAWHGVNLAAVDTAKSWWRVLERHKLDSRVLMPGELMLHLVIIKQGWNKSVTLRFILKEADGDDCAAYVDSIIAENMQRVDAPPSPRLIRAQSASRQSTAWSERRRRYGFGRLSVQKSTGASRANSNATDAYAEGLLGDAGNDWQCLTCTFRNIVPDAAVCEVCGADRIGIKPKGMQPAGHTEQTAADDDADQDDNCAHLYVPSLSPCSRTQCIFPSENIQSSFDMQHHLLLRCHLGALMPLRLL